MFQQPTYTYVEKNGIIQEAKQPIIISPAQQLMQLDQQKQYLAVQEGILLKKAIGSDNPFDVMKANEVINRNLRDVEQRTPTNAKSYIFNPLETLNNLGYKDKPISLTYQTLRRMGMTPIIKAIIGTRKDQVAAFAVPQKDISCTKPGFTIRKKQKIYGDTEEKMTKSDYVIAEAITKFILNCGKEENRWHGDTFDSYLRKTTQDLLELDQSAAECVRNRRGYPTEFFATDGATYRLADSYDDERYTKHDKEKINGYYPSFVQIYENQIRAEFYPWELALGMMNVGTNVYANGYGQSMLEVLMHTVTAILWADEYNRKFFSVGSAPKGILKVGAKVNERSLQEFKQNWIAQMQGVQNSHRTPILPAEDVEWIDLQGKNRDMEFSAYYNFLIQVSCSVFKIAPEEVGFQFGNQGQTNAMGESNGEYKIEFSRDKGLAPIMNFKEAEINKYIVNALHPDFELKWTGLNPENEAQKLDSDIKKISTFITVNETRKEYGLKPIKGGDIILSPIMMQKAQMDMQQEQMAAQQQDQEEQTNNRFGGENVDDEEEDNPMAKSFENWLNREHGAA